MATRESAREGLAALLSSAGGFNVVNAFLPLSLGGATKVVNVYSRSSRLDRISEDMKNNFHTFHVDALVLRAGTAADEDNIDTLHEIIMGVIVANPQTANWSHIKADEETDKRPVQDEGKQYLMERHRVTVKLTG